MTNIQVFPKLDEIEDFFKQVAKDCQEVGLTTRQASFNINSRLKRTLGRCSKQVIKTGDQEQFFIDINSYVIQTHSVALLRDVVAHELIHTIPGCYNHGPTFQDAAKKLNGCFPDLYNVQVKTNLADYDLEAPKTNHYEIVCKDCHHTMYRERMSKTLRHIDRYRCPKCHGLLEVYPVGYGN
ncbi:MAG: hypothetical protein HDR44_03190 [Allobaculum sp.]|nr:hypothetical protein [Allobaculum sp.]